MTNSILSNVITSLLWTAAICHVLTDRLLKPFALSMFAALVDETAVAPAVLTIVPTPVVVEPAVVAVTTPRPARRRKSSAKVPV